MNNNFSINEYVPNGYSSWTAYNRHTARMEKVKYWAQGFAGALVLLGAYAFNGFVDTVLFPM